ncbi:hypothetical protein LQW54_008938 [Pestalotiopsis sp. IQ-011]
MRTPAGPIAIHDMSAPHHALVFGASGILGWSVVDQILKNYPEEGVFRKVTALSNRPLSAENAFWPVAEPGTPALQIVDGIDLTSGTIYYFAYMFHPDFPTETQINLGMLQRGFVAAESLAPNLQYVIVPTGTKGYGIHLPQRPFEAPVTEDMDDIYQPWHDELFYFALHGELDKLQQGNSWKFAEVRCGPVIGFVPHSNPYNLPGVFMNFLSVYKFLHEQGHPDARSREVPFPAPIEAYDTLWNDGGQDIFAEFSIHLCLHPDAAGNSEVYNIGDASDPAFVLPAAFVKAHPEAVARLREDKGVVLQEVALEGFLERFGEFFAFHHHFSVDKARKTGFTHELSLEDSWRTVFDRCHQAKRCYCGA